MRNIVVFTGAGISAESGLKTFRDSDGLWEEHRIEDVATPEAWRKNPGLVLEFYNQRRKQVLEAQPNPAHQAIKELEKKFTVYVVTQNIDDLHERAGSQHVMHLHGEIRKSRSTFDQNLVSEIEGWELKQGDKCKHGSQLRPHIVWFGEMVPAMDEAVQITSKADLLLIVGTSLEVYPAAGLVMYADDDIAKIIVDPNARNINQINNLTVIKEKAGVALPALVQKLLNDE